MERIYSVLRQGYAKTIEQMAKGYKTGGRKAGTPNRLTRELRAVLKDFLYGELINIPNHLDKLDPKERLEIIVKILPYVLPTVKSVHHQENEPFNGYYEVQ